MNITKYQLNFEEVFNFINDVVESTFGKDENGNDIEFRPMGKFTAIQSLFCEYYTDLEFTDDFDKNYELFMNVNIDSFIKNKSINENQWYYILSSIDQEVEFRKQKLLQPKSTIEDAITALLSTLNDKAKELDVKKLEKVIKKLNPREILKAYQKSGVGESVRDKAIQEQAQEIKDLKNQISAKNVMAK